jgi:hypothetical protein
MMSEEIKFYGIGGTSKSPVTLSSASGEELRCYGIFLPNASTLSLDELDKVDPSLFPWPMNVFIPSPKNTNSKPTFIRSHAELREFLDDTRDPAAMINFSLPPQGPNIKAFVGVYAYMGNDFTFVHNTKLDQGFLTKNDNSKLFTRINLGKDKVLRIVRGSQGWFYDSVFSRDQECLAPIYDQSLMDLKKMDNFRLFQLGYQAGFFGEGSTYNISPGLISLQYLGDPYTLGFYLGSRNRSEIAQMSSDNGVVDKHLLLRLKVTCSDQEFESKVGLLNLHNKIQTGSGFEPLEIVHLLNPKCKLIITNTFAACGEGGEYCSESCKEAAKVSRSSYSHFLDSLCHTIMESQEKKGDYPLEPLVLPEDISSIQVDFVWKGMDTQFRIVTEENDKVNYRFQSRDPELQNKITCGNDSFIAIAYKELGRAELDIAVNREKVGLSESEFQAYKDAIRNATFNKPSQYSGSTMKYASLTYNNNGFCLEDGTVVIPKDTFFKYLQKNKGVKVNLTNSDNLSEEI